VRNGHKGVVEVHLDGGPMLSFRVERSVVDTLQADEAAQSA
jgi:hypothetical protein